ncbi:hypothetical protein ScPMuIL_009882 [Solemya velum]
MVLLSLCIWAKYPLIIEKFINMAMVTEEVEDNAMETAETWSPPDGSFSKQILLPAGVCCGPEDGSVCVVNLELVNSDELRDVPLDSGCVGYPLGDSVSVHVGEGDTEMSQILDRCILSMKPGEISEFTFDIPVSGTVSFNSNEIEQRHVLFRMELKSIVDQKMLCQLTDFEKFKNAQRHKEKGTLLYKTGTVASAFRRFSKSLHYLHLMSPEIPDEIYPNYKQLKCHCYLNLAACQLQFGGFNHAVINCTKALELDSRSVKAFYRRAQGYIEMGELQEAAADLVQASGIEPQNCAVQQLLHSVQVQFQVQNRALSAGLSKMFKA